MVIRDPAHAIRISTQKPLQLEEEFGKVYEELIGKRHALIPDIPNSGRWRLQLQAIEGECLRIPCLSREGAMKVVLRHLSLAKQRMDSAADPLAKLCLMLMPVCMLLAYKASDERCKKDDRERAENLLAKMQPKFLLQAGVSADWGIITVAFLRAFDCKKHDIANSQAEMERFLETMDACFVQGGVFCPVPLPAARPACGGCRGWIHHRAGPQADAAQVCFPLRQQAPGGVGGVQACGSRRYCRARACGGSGVQGTRDSRVQGASHGVVSSALRAARGPREQTVSREA